jgi:hypothetical protein
MSASQLGITPVPLGLYNSGMVNSVLVLLYQIGGIWVVVAVTLHLMGSIFSASDRFNLDGVWDGI